MGFAASNVVPFTQARANLSELADQAKAGAEKIITKNGESYVALIDSDRLDYYHRLERERIHLTLIQPWQRYKNGERPLRIRLARANKTSTRTRLMLYTVMDANPTVYLLSIRHHRQLSFDFARLWP